jgi:hypothetical protein
MGKGPASIEPPELPMDDDERFLHDVLGGVAAAENLRRQER